MNHSVIKLRKWSVSAILATAFSAIILAGCSREPDPDATTAALVEIVKKDDKYADWAKVECLQFMVEQQDEKQTEVAMREKHGDGCPGDPQVSPVIDRFRIERMTGAILRYDIIEDKYLLVGSMRKQ